MDVVHYNENFHEMLSMAKRLGTKSLIVIGLSEREFRLHSKNAGTTMLFPAIQATANGLNKLGKAGNAIVVSQDASRQFVEHPHIDCIIDAESMERKDRLHQRNSGLNEPLSGIIASTGKVLLFDMSLLCRKGNDRILGRFMQNAVLSTKKRIPSLVVSGASFPYELRGAEELRSFSAFIGLHPGAAKAAEAKLTRKALLGQ